MPRDILTQNFLYGDRGQKRRRASFWGFKRPEAPPSIIDSSPDSPLTDGMVDSRGDARHSRTRPDQRSRRNPPRTEEDQNTQHSPGDQNSPGPHPPFAMYPFSQLSMTVKQCPWILGSDIRPSALGHNPDFYLPVPRSVKHDTAVSFVIKDQTRPEQPEFVISCPLEHVNLVREILAPAGSHRTLSARGSSGHPRGADELRNMLLDGIPRIELSLHAIPSIDAVVPADESDHNDHRDSRDAEPGQSRRRSFVQERPIEPFQTELPQESNAPQSFSQPFVPAMLVPHGWCAAPGGNFPAPRMENVAADYGNSLVIMSPNMRSLNYTC